MMMLIIISAGYLDRLKEGFLYPPHLYLVNSPHILPLRLPLPASKQEMFYAFLLFSAVARIIIQ